MTTLDRGDSETKGLEGASVVRTQELGVCYDDKWALKGINIDIPFNTITVVGGGNGAGKTSLLKTIGAQLTHDEGGATVLGLAVSDSPAVIRTRTGFMPDITDCHYSWLSVRALLDYHSRFFARWNYDKANSLGDRLGIENDTRVGDLSPGHYRRLQLLMALAHEPELVLLDEPTLGMDRRGRSELSSIIVEYASDVNSSIIIATNDVEFYTAIAGRFVFLEDGQVAVEASREVLREKCYLYVVSGCESIDELGLQGYQHLSKPVQKDGQVECVIVGERSAVCEAIERGGGEVAQAHRISIGRLAEELQR